MEKRGLLMPAFLCLPEVNEILKSLNHPMQILPATKSDLSSIIPLWKKFMDDSAVWEETFQPSPDWEQHITSHLEKLLENERAQVLVAKEEDLIVGYAIIQITNNVPVFKQFDRGFITDLCVQENHRNKGIGKKMLQEIFAWFKSKGINRVELMALENNVLGRKFWKRMRFEEYMHRMYTRI